MNFSIASFKRELFAALLLIPTTFAVAQTPFAGEDFDGGAIGGFTALTYTQTPDDTVAPNGNFTSGFDLWGILDPEGNGSFVPFDLLDESANDTTVFDGMGGSIPDLTFDDLGILRVGDRDKVFAISDLENGDNPTGLGTAVWTFDISGQSNIELSIDMAAQGDFENITNNVDSYNFTYSIDGGSSQSLFTIESDDSQTTTVMLESGNDFVDNFFFQQGVANWLTLEALGTSFSEDPDGIPLSGDEFTIDFDPDDLDQDGYVSVDLNGTPTLVRSFQITNFDDMGAQESQFVNTEYEPNDELVINDPLYVNGDSVTGTQLTNIMTTFTESIVGTGSTLTLTLDVFNNGGNEYVVFDDIVLASGAVVGLDGDFNNDGEVDAADYTIWRDNLGGDASTLNGNGDGDSDVDIDDYNLWAGNFGASSSPSAASASAVPEPAAALLMLCGVAGLITRRRS